MSNTVVYVLGHNLRVSLTCAPFSRKVDVVLHSRQTSVVVKWSLQAGQSAWHAVELELMSPDTEITL